MPSDFRIEYHGTITLVRPLTQACREWLCDEVEAGAMWFGGAVAVEPRYLGPLVGLMEEAGFEGEE